MRGYWRRRGWQAWHVAMLSRAEPANLPALSDLMGIDPPPDEDERAAIQTAHNLRLWSAALKRRFAQCPP